MVNKDEYISTFVSLLI